MKQEKGVVFLKLKAQAPFDFSSPTTLFDHYSLGLYTFYFQKMEALQSPLASKEPLFFSFRNKERRKFYLFFEEQKFKNFDLQFFSAFQSLNCAYAGLWAEEEIVSLKKQLPSIREWTFPEMQFF